MGSAKSPFTGLVADARVFTFASGAFRPSDLNVVPKPTTGPGRAVWMEGKYGLMCSLDVADIDNSHNGAWDTTVNNFNTDAFAAQVNSTGASFVVFTLGWITGYYTAPNSAFQSITGQSGYCSQRNLIADIHASLQKVNPDIKLMVYLATEGPRLAPAAITGSTSLNCENGAGPLWGDFRKKFNAMVKEWSQTLGPKVSGWWLDGAYSYWQIGYDANGTLVYGDPADGSRGLDNLNNLITACRAGNPNTVVACNTYMIPEGPNGYTTQADFTTGEVNYLDRVPISPTVPVTDANGTSTLHWNATSFLGKYWCDSSAGPYTSQQLANYVYFACKAKGSVIIQLGSDQTGNISPAQLAQMVVVNDAVNVKQTYTDYSFVSNGLNVTNLAAYKPSWMMSSHGNYELPINQNRYSMSYGNDASVGCHYPATGNNGINDPVQADFAMPGGEYDWNYKVDLGGSKAFNYYVLTEPLNFFTTSYAIEGSNDATTWTTLLSASKSTGGRRSGFFDSTVTCRYVRVRCLAPNGPNQLGVGMAIQEFELYQLPVTNTLAPLKECRFDSYGSNIGISGTPMSENLYTTGFIGTDPNFGNINQEYRTVWQFKLDTLWINAADVVSASLKWTPNALWGSNTLAIDRVNSDLTTWNTIPMYGGALSTIAANLNNINPGVVDITGVFRNALTNATVSSGLALRFYNSGNPGDFNACGIGNVNIELVAAPQSVTPSFSVQRDYTNNTAVITGSGGSGALGYSIQSSTNGADWSTIAINQAFGPGGTVNFTYAPATEIPSNQTFRVCVP